MVDKAILQKVEYQVSEISKLMNNLQEYISYHLCSEVKSIILNKYLFSKHSNINYISNLLKLSELIKLAYANENTFIEEANNLVSLLSTEECVFCLDHIPKIIESNNNEFSVDYNLFYLKNILVTRYSNLQVMTNDNTG